MNRSPLNPSSPTSAYSGETLEIFSDLMADATEPENVAALALEFMLQEVNLQSGLLLVQTPVEPSPYLMVQKNLPEYWVHQAIDALSPLRQAAQNTLEAGLPSGKNESLGLAAAIPIVSRSGQQGVLLAYGSDCSQADIDWLMQLSHTLGRSLRVARRINSTQKRVKDLAAFQMVITNLGFNSELEELQNQTVQAVCRVLDVEVGALILLDEEQPELFSRKLLRQETEWIYQVNLKLEDSLIQDCLTSRTPLLSNLPQRVPHFQARLDGLEGVEVTTLLLAPLIVDGQVLGAIQVLNKRAGPFDSTDEDLLTMVADLAARGLFSSRLIQQLKVANADLEASHWELLRSRNTLRALFDSIPSAVYIVDHKFKLIAINMSCASRNGKTPKTTVGRQCYEALYGRSEPCPGCRVSETLFSGQSTIRTERRWGTEEDPTEWEISTYPILDEMDKVVSAILLEQDVTEKRRLESIVAQSEKLAAVGQLAAGVAHEINNPLTAIIANAQLLQRELPDDEEVQESIDLIIRAGARATQVVRNLLDFARKEQYHLDQTDINETLQHALALVQHELLARSISLSFEPDKNLPRVLASQDHLQGVWLNLLLNGVDAMDNNGEGQLRVVTRKVGNEVRVSFIDNGKGIPPERISRIFEPFYTTKAPGRGTGLGLSLCHRIIKQHGGHIHVDSQVGSGTEFTVVLPIS